MRRAPLSKLDEAGQDVGMHSEAIRGKRHAEHLYPSRLKPGRMGACRAKRFGMSC